MMCSTASKSSWVLRLFGQGLSRLLSKSGDGRRVSSGWFIFLADGCFLRLIISWAFGRRRGGRVEVIRLIDGREAWRASEGECLGPVGHGRSHSYYI